jgi:hypothetical protein
MSRLEQVIFVCAFGFAVSAITAWAVTRHAPSTLTTCAAGAYCCRVEFVTSPLSCPSIRSVAITPDDAAKDPPN